jgi:formate dehydrogenase maturation protein FdhE
MAERTTISVTKALKEALDDEQMHKDESYESQLWRLLEDSEGTDTDAVEKRIDDLENNLTKMIEELQSRKV